MHDIGRTQLEMGWEAEPYGNGESEYEDEYEFEDEYDGEYETYDNEYEDGIYGEVEGPFSDADEMELAAELLELSDEEELDQFIGKLFGKIARKVRKAIPRGVRRSLGRQLKGLARRVLPTAGAALGNIVAPGIGGTAGGALAAQAGRAFGLELEGLSPEDQEFEVARRFVRLAGDAAEQATQAPEQAPPDAVAQKTVAAAVQKHAPGLAERKGAGRKNANGGDQGRRKSKRGTWERRGNAVILREFFG